MQAEARKFVVEVHVTQRFEIEVTAQDEGTAELAALEVYRSADEVGGYEIGDLPAEAVAVTAA